MRGGPSLHEHHVEDVSHVNRIARAGQEPIDEQLPLVRRRVVEKGSRFNRRRQIAGQIESDSTQKIGVACQRSNRADLTRIDQLIDARSQRLCSGDDSQSARRSNERKQNEATSRQAGCHGGVLGGLGDFK